MPCAYARPSLMWALAVHSHIEYPSAQWRSRSPMRAESVAREQFKTTEAEATAHFMEERKRANVPVLGSLMLLMCR